MDITNKQALSEVKNYVAKLGFTFKVNDSKYINGKTCYKLCKRYTDDVITDKYGNSLSNFTIDTGYENMLSGYFVQLAQDEKHYNSFK